MIRDDNKDPSQLCNEQSFAGAGNMNLPPEKFDIDGFSQGLVEAGELVEYWAAWQSM